MCECLRARISQRIEEHELVRSVGQVLLAANHMGDLHGRVVEGTGEVIDGETVRFHDDEVADERAVEAHLATDHVRETDLAARDLEAHGELCASGWRIGQAAPRVHGRSLLRLRQLALGVQLLGCAIAAIGLAFAQELRGSVLVQVEPFALPVGPTGAALVGPLVPIKTQPVQAFVDDHLVLGTIALHVRVIDAQH